MSDTVQIFISYARHDDTKLATEGDAPGFVSYLHQHLEFEFIKNGRPWPVLWRDINRVAEGDRFDPKIAGAIETSSVFLVVMSNNWLASEYCRRELDMFAQRWRDEPPLALQERIILVNKREVDLAKVPPLLQGQVGYAFFAKDRGDPLGSIEDFYDPGRARDPRFYEPVKKLATFLLRTAAGLPDGKARPPQPREPAQVGPRNGRVIYVSETANDLRDDRKRIVEELTGRGYEVIPDPTPEIPDDTSTADFIDANLQRSELAVHLLGTKLGYKPEDAAAAIVPLQLSRSAARCDREPKTTSGGFRRIVWAPKNKGEEIDRDPFAVLQKLDRQLPTDKIMGDSVSAFVDNLLNYLAQNPPPRPQEKPQPGRPGTAARIYLNHAKVDSDYAAAVAKALRKRQIVATLAEVEGEEAEVRAFNSKRLQNCDTVAVCWAEASAVSVRSLASELANWETLGRTQQFTLRAIVAGPPPVGRKKHLDVLFSPSEIDEVLDLSGFPEPPPDKLDPLFGGAGMPAP